MRKLFLLLSFVSIFSSVLFAQSIPEGMNYQAVARNLKGEILPNQPIALRAILFSVQNGVNTEFYRETHDVLTSTTGVFSLVVGQGNPESGKFDKIPWSNENIWMEISIKSKGQSDFAIVSNSKLLAVPYAFHAFTAEKLIGDTPDNTGVPAQSWLLFGNRNSSPLVDKLGTTDFVDLVVVTNDMERMRIYAGGNILIKRSLQVGASLTVDSSAFLNRLGGATINYGPFTVDRLSPTLLSGTLTVDKATDLNSSLNVDGPTDLNSRLNVNNQKPTKLTGTLQVDGVTTLNDSTFVANSKPTVLTGYLRVDSNSTFKQRVILDNAALVQDTASLVPMGALQVAGGAGIGGNLTVAGSARIGGGLALGSLKVTDPIPSTSETTGAVTVVGGVGIGMQLNVGGKTVINNSMDVNAGNGQVKITGGVNGDDQNSLAYPLVISGKKQGIEIRLNDVATPDNTNNFVTFRDKNNTIRGRIEGQTSADLQSDPWYVWSNANVGISVATATIFLATQITTFIADIADIRICIGLGICSTPPSIIKIIASGINVAAFALGLAQAVVNYIQFHDTQNSNLGVSFSSSAGDYAEWLPRESLLAKLQPGYVVGVRNGMVSLNTEGAERVFVISTNPIVLGNTPEAGKESFYEKVAFMGQVPVRVVGKVNPGDFIIASGKYDGTGIARNKKDITIEDLPNIVGIAWWGSDQESEKMIKVAVGLSNSDLKTIVMNLQDKMNLQIADMNELKKQSNYNNELLAKLIPGFKPVTLLLDNTISITPPKETGIKETTIQANNSYSATDLLNTVKDPSKINRVKQEISDVFGAKLNNPETERFPEMTDNLIDKFLEWGSVLMEENSINPDQNDQNPFLQKIKTDPALKSFIYDKIKEVYKEKIKEHFQVMQERGAIK